MPKATCKKCGKIWYGWALKNPEHQTCDCEEKLEKDKKE